MIKQNKRAKDDHHKAHSPGPKGEEDAFALTYLCTELERLKNDGDSVNGKVTAFGVNKDIVVRKFQHIKSIHMKMFKDHMDLELHNDNGKNDERQTNIPPIKGSKRRTDKLNDVITSLDDFHASMKDLNNEISKSIMIQQEEKKEKDKERKLTVEGRI